MMFLPHCRVNVKFHLFTTEEGGREKGIYNCYRADHALSDDCVLTMGPLYFLNKEQETLNTGESADMQVIFIISHNSKPKIVNLKQGDKWKVFEGQKCVGECEMLERITTDEELNNQMPVTW